MNESEIEKTVAVNIKRLRGERNVSLSELARRSGVAKATLSSLEAGGNPTIQTLSALAAALGCSLGDLITDATPQLLRADEGTWLDSDSARGRVIARLFGQQGVDVHEVIFRAGKPFTAEPLLGTIEHLYIVKGQIDAQQGSVPIRLSSGDILRLADQPYTLQAIDSDARALIFVNSAATAPRPMGDGTAQPS